MAWQSALHELLARVIYAVSRKKGDPRADTLKALDVRSKTSIRSSMKKMIGIEPVVNLKKHSCQLRNIDKSSTQGLAIGKKRW